MFGGSVSVAAVIFVACAAPVAASQTVGQNFIPSATCTGNNTYYPFTSPAPSQYDAQSAGVITSWKFTTGADPIPGFRFKVGHLTGADSIKTLASETTDLAAVSSETHPVRIPVAAGDRIGFYLPAPAVCTQTNAGASFGAGYAGGDQAPNTTTSYIFQSNFKYPLSAQVEGDVDGDGFGDETQDTCIGTGGPKAGCPATNTGTGAQPPASDTIKPTLGSLGFARTTFKAARSGAALGAQKKRRTVPTGTKVSFGLSEPSSVRFTVQRKTAGRRVSGRCKARTKKNATKAKCTRWKSVTGAFTYAGKAGKNTFTFRGRVGGKALKPGSYRLSGTATDPAKNASVPKQKGFRIVRR